jgi:hypothetical protein
LRETLEFSQQVYSSHRLLNSKLRSIQRVRYYLQATYISDVYNAEGEDVLDEVQRHQPITCSTTTKQYPLQPKPLPNDWVVLLELLRDAEVRLGPWLPTWQAHRHWNQLFRPTQGYCWVRNNGKWNCYLNLIIPN